MLGLFVYKHLYIIYQSICLILTLKRAPPTLIRLRLNLSKRAPPTLIPNGYDRFSHHRIIHDHG